MVFLITSKRFFLRRGGGGALLCFGYIPVMILASSSIDYWHFLIKELFCLVMMIDGHGLCLIVLF